MSKKVPVTIFTGFLGSGKSTLINELVTRNSQLTFGLIINEFGSVGIDSDIVSETKENTIEVSNGCACCVVRTDLDAAVSKMLTEIPHIDYLIVEASGLAEPGPIAQTFLHNVTAGAASYLDSIVCVVDCENFISNWDEYEVLHNQINVSDLVVLNKAHRNPEQTQKVTEFVKRMKPDAVLITVGDHSTSDLSALLDTHSFDLEGEAEHDHHHHEHDHEHFDEVVYSSDAKLDPNKLDEAFRSKEFSEIIRAKGFIRLAHKPDTTFLFQLVGHGRQLSPYPHLKKKNYIVMMGKHLPSDAILSALKNAEIA